MPTAEKLLSRKAGEVASLNPDATVLEAAQLMNDRHIGSVLICEDERLVGIFTERDLMRRVVAAGRDPAKLQLKEVMTTAVVCAAPHTTLNEMRTVIREKRIRHLPVLQEGKAIGMISIGDLNIAEMDVQEQTIRYLAEFMSRL